MLSTRATEYVSRLDRQSAIAVADEVRAAFSAQSLQCPDAILHFQVRFGGLVMNAGLEPMVATILHPQANFLRDRPWNVADVSCHNGLTMFNCMETLCQMDFHLDEHGHYYEDLQPVHDSFEKLLEGIAFLASRSEHGNWSMIRDPKNELRYGADEFERHGLETDGLASCQYTTYWYNDAIIVRCRDGEVTAWRNEQSQITKP